MKTPSTPRTPLLTTLGLALTAACTSAQTLPPSAPTRPTPTPAASQFTATTTPLSSAAKLPTYRARIDFTNGALSVVANNSSLNEILRDIAIVTGMKITGGVNEEHVFGSYGPGPTQDVLGKLLDGTGSNVLIRSDSSNSIRELVLTPRQGSATPPNPNSSRNSDRDSDDTDLPPQLGGRRRGARTFENERPPEPVQNTPPLETPAQQPAQEQPAAASPETNDNATQQSPNGVKTPQQIYEELVQKQSQGKQNQTSTPQP